MTPITSTPPALQKRMDACMDGESIAHLVGKNLAGPRLWPSVPAAPSEHCMLDQFREHPSQVAFPEPLRRRTGRVHVESPRRVAEIARAHDVVALEDRAGPVPGELHRHALGHAARTRFRTAVQRIVRDVVGTTWTASCRGRASTFAAASLRSRRARPPAPPQASRAACSVSLCGADVDGFRWSADFHS